LLNGRGTITLPGSNGMNSLAVYPSTGGFLIMSIDSATVASGAAFTQQISTPSNASLTGRYGFSLGGANTAGTVDAIAQFTADGTGHLAGHLDENSAGTLVMDWRLPELIRFQLPDAAPQPSIAMPER